MEEVVGAVLAVMDALVVVKEVVLEDANRHVLVVLVSVAEIVILVVKAVVMLNALVIV